MVGRCLEALGPGETRARQWRRALIVFAWAVVVWFVIFHAPAFLAAVAS